MLVRILFLLALGFSFIGASALFLGIKGSYWQSMMPFILVFLGCGLRFVIALPYATLKQAWSDAHYAFGSPLVDQKGEKFVREMVELASHFRKEGALALDAWRSRLQDPLLVHSLKFLQEAWDPQLVRQLFAHQMEQRKQKFTRSAQIWSELSQFAPSAGIIVGILYLILFLSQYETGQISFIALGFSFLSFLVGLLLSQFIFAPIAFRIQTYSVLVLSEIEWIRDGICGVLSGMSPAQIEEQLKKQMGLADS